MLVSPSSCDHFALDTFSKTYLRVSFLRYICLLTGLQNMSTSKKCQNCHANKKRTMTRYYFGSTNTAWYMPFFLIFQIVLFLYIFGTGLVYFLLRNSSSHRRLSWGHAETDHCGAWPGSAGAAQGLRTDSQDRLIPHALKDLFDLGYTLNICLIFDNPVFVCSFF